MLFATIDQDATSGCIGGDIDDLCSQNSPTDCGGGLLKSFQATVISGQSRDQLQLTLCEQQLFTQTRVLIDEITVGNEHVVYPVRNARGDVGYPIDRGGKETKGVSDSIKIVEAAVGEHSHYRKSDEDGDAEFQRYSFDE